MSSSSGETISTPEHTINLDECDLLEIAEDIDLHLFLRSADGGRVLGASDVYQMLREKPQLYDAEYCFNEIRTSFTDHVTKEVADIRNQYTAEIRAQFPSTEIKELKTKTPKRYMAQHGLSGTYRPQLREAQTSAFKESKSRLLDAFAEDTAESLLGPLVSDEDLVEYIQAARAQTITEIRETVEALKTLLPKQKINPHSTEALVLQLKGYSGEYKLDPLRDESEEHAFQDLINRLRNNVRNYAKGSKYVIETVLASITGSLGSQISDTLHPHYQALIDSEVEVLSHKLTVAYDSAVRGGSAYIAPEKASTHTADKKTPKSSTMPEKEAQGDYHLTTIVDAFPWSEGNATEIRVDRSGGSDIVYCTALPQSAAAISDNLRKKHGPNGPEFERIWKHVRALEATSNNGAIPNPNKVHSVTNEYFAEQMILGYGNSSPNAKRIYYVRSTCDQYPSITQAAEAAGINQDATLLILVAETDKANQLRTYHDFGIGRAAARNYNVGAV